MVWEYEGWYIYTEFNMLENAALMGYFFKKSWKAGDQNWPKNNQIESGTYIGPLGFINLTLVRYILISEFHETFWGKWLHN